MSRVVYLVVTCRSVMHAPAIAEIVYIAANSQNTIVLYIRRAVGLHWLVHAAANLSGSKPLYVYWQEKR